MRRWISLIVAAAMVFSAGAPSVALAARPAAGDRTLFETWAVELNGLSIEAAAAFDTFQTWSVRNQSINTREQAIAAAREYLPLFTEARRKVQAVQVRADAVKPFRSADPYVTEMAAGLLKDTRDYVSRLERILATCEELMAAIAVEDGPRMERAIGKLRDAGAVMAEGQLTMVRGRQAMFDRDDPNHHTLGAVVTLYEGMRAALYARLSMVTREEAAGQMRASARRCRASAAEARRTADLLAAEPGFVRGSDRHVRDQIEIAGSIAEALEKAATIMVGGDDDSTVFSKVMTIFTVLEESYMASVEAEIALPET